MCGLAGVAGPSGSDITVLADQSRAMADSLVHRGPDSGAVQTWAPGHVALAHRRLAVIDLSDDAAQPMTSPSGRWIVVFNGEIYNHRSLRADLVHAGVQFRGHGDTETLVAAIDTWGIDDALRRTNGMFALAALDTRDARLLLARDRLGEKPLYWTLSSRGMAFASELRALRTLPWLDLRIDPQSVSSVLRWSYVPHPATIYLGVQQVSPGEIVTVSLDTGGSSLSAQRRTWWSLDDAVEAGTTGRVGPQPSRDEAAAQVRTLLEDAVAMRMESDVPLGAFLSGGIDSSLVAALAQSAIGDRRLNTFTVSMPGTSMDETAHAAAVARHIGSDHHTIDLSAADAIALVPHLGTLWDEPFADPSMLPTALVCRAAREHVTVCLSGDGGDEVFAGYNRHVAGASLHRRVHTLPTGVRHGLGRLALAPTPRTIDRLARLVPTSRRPPNVGDKMQKVGTLMSDDGDAWSAFAGTWPVTDLGSAPHPPAGPHVDGLSAIEQMVLTDTASVLPDQMLVKVDRASMASSLEVRVPLIDHRLVEWAWAQPLATRTSHGVGKVVLRDVAASLLPQAIVGRRKMGFDPPLASWLRGDLAPWASDLLARPRCVEEGWVSGDAVRTAWREHRSGTRNWDYKLWGVLMLESWLGEHHA